MAQIKIKIPLQPFNYLIYREGNVYHAMNGKNGAVEISGTEPAEVIQYAVDKVNLAGGGTVFIKAGEYYFPYGKRVYIKDNIAIKGEGRSTRIYSESQTFAINSVKNVKISDLYIAPYGLAEEAKDTGTPYDAVAGIGVGGTDTNPSMDIVIENVVVEGERAWIHIGPWSKDTDTPVVYDFVLKNSILRKKGDSAYPVGNMVLNYVERAWIHDNYFSSRDWRTVPHNPAKPWSIFMAVTRYVKFTNNIIDGSHHNNIAGGKNYYTFYIGNTFRHSDDCIDTNDSHYQFVIGNMCEDNGNFASFEGTSSNIVVEGNIVRNISSLFVHSDARKVIIRGNTGDTLGLLEQGSPYYLEDAIIEGNDITVRGRALIVNLTQLVRVKIINNTFKLADLRIWIGKPDAQAIDVEIAGNTFIGSTTTDDIQFFLASYDAGTGTKYYWARHVRIHDNVFRNTRHVYFTMFPDSEVYVWNNINLGYLDGGNYQTRMTDPSVSGYILLAQSNVRMTVSFDASVLGSQTQTVSNYLNMMPKLGQENYVALASIRSAPSGWAGYVMARPNPTNPQHQVDVTLVTTQTATGTVEVEVVLMEAEPQIYGYTQPASPRWKR